MTWRLFGSTTDLSGMLDHPLSRAKTAGGPDDFFAIVIASAAKQSNFPFWRAMDCFAALAMTAKYASAISPHVLREFYQFVPPSPVRGRRECRAPDVPDSRVCRGSGRDAHALVRSQRNHPAFPAQWFTAYSALSPVTGLSCHRHP